MIRGRKFIEESFDATCRITRVTGKELNRTTAKNEDTVEVVYEGPCKVRIAAASAGISERDLLGQHIAVGEEVLSLPVAEETGNVIKNDRVLILTNAHDDEMSGKTFRVKKSSTQSYATARRLPIEEKE